MPDRPEVISSTKARGGITPHIVRYVLGGSLVLGVVALAWAFVAAPVATQHAASPQQSANSPQPIAPRQ